MKSYCTTKYLRFKNINMIPYDDDDPDIKLLDKYNPIQYNSDREINNINENDRETISLNIMFRPITQATNKLPDFKTIQDIISDSKSSLHIEDKGNDSNNEMSVIGKVLPIKNMVRPSTAKTLKKIPMIQPPKINTIPTINMSYSKQLMITPHICSITKK